MWRSKRVGLDWIINTQGKGAKVLRAGLCGMYE